MSLGNRRGVKHKEKDQEYEAHKQHNKINITHHMAIISVDYIQPNISLSKTGSKEQR